jgi:hypothetical protein
MPQKTKKTIQPPVTGLDLPLSEQEARDLSSIVYAEDAANSAIKLAMDRMAEIKRRKDEWWDAAMARRGRPHDHNDANFCVTARPGELIAKAPKRSA